MSECLGLCLVQYVSGDDGAKELVITVIKVISPVRMNGLKVASCLLKGRSRDETHVTLIQEMNVQWEDLLPIQPLLVKLYKIKK